MVNEVVGSGDWSEEESLGETWKGRNVFSYGRNEGNGEGITGTARGEVLDKLLQSTERVIQEIDSVRPILHVLLSSAFLSFTYFKNTILYLEFQVEYGLTDIQEYYANT